MKINNEYQFLYSCNINSSSISIVSQYLCNDMCVCFFNLYQPVSKYSKWNVKNMTNLY